MKGWLLSLAVALALTCASDVAAQTTAPGSTNAARPDVSASLGWLNGNKSDLSSHNNWYNRALHGAVTFGWHWSTHLKTELETSASTEAEFYANREEIINGLRANVAAEYAFSTRRLTLAQQYQFGDNAWFHPHLAAGLDVNWEKIRQVDRDVYFYDARQTTIIRRSTVHPTRTDVHIRPLVNAGFKAYMTPRSFFRSDLRLVGARRIEDVLLRFGFGVDF